MAPRGDRAPHDALELGSVRADGGVAKDGRRSPDPVCDRRDVVLETCGRARLWFVAGNQCVLPRQLTEPPDIGSDVLIEGSPQRLELPLEQLWIMVWETSVS